MTAADLYKRLTDIATSDIAWIRITMDDGRTVKAGVVEAVTDDYRPPSYGTVDLSVEFADGVFEENADFPSDCGYVYQRQTGQAKYTDPVLNVWDVKENEPDENRVGTITAVEEVPDDE